MRRRSPLEISLCFLLTLLLVGCQSADEGSDNQRVVDAIASGEEVVTGTVTLRIIADEKETVEVELPDIAEGESLESVMRNFKDCPVEISGSGTTAFVQSIDGLSTSGSEGWTFKVDGEFANQGIGETTLSPPTTVEWSYGGFE